MSPLSYFRRSVVAFPLAALAALAMFVISEVSYQDATSSLDSLGERATARIRLNQVAKSLLDAETGQRGYLLSNRQEYLNPYRDAQEGLRESTEWLKKYYASDPRMAELMQQLSAAVEEKMSELATSIDLHDRGSHQAWRDLLLSDIGKERMDRVRALTEQLLAEEAGNQRAADADQDVADDAEPGAAHDLAGEPARDQADEQDNQNAFVGNLHRKPLLSPPATLPAITERCDSIPVPP